jgi:hypothetical protein
MGSWNRYEIDVNTMNDALLAKVFAEGRKLDDCPDPWDDACFRQWSSETGWSPYTMIQALSKAFPELTFSVKAYGDNFNDGLDEAFCKAGFWLQTEEVFERPVFPTAEQFEAGKVAKSAAMAKAKAEREAAEKKRLLEEKKARIKELKAELRKLAKTG